MEPDVLDGMRSISGIFGGFAMIGRAGQPLGSAIVSSSLGVGTVTAIYHTLRSCDELIQKCPAGRYGDQTRLSSDSCSGECSASTARRVRLANAPCLRRKPTAPRSTTTW